MDTKENKSMRDRLIDILGLTLPKDWSATEQYSFSLSTGEVTNSEAIAVVLVNKAINGDLDAIKVVFDQVDGKSPIFVKSRTHPEDTCDYVFDDDETKRNDLRIDEIVKHMEKLKNDVCNFNEEVGNIKCWSVVKKPNDWIDRLKRMREDAMHIAHLSTEPPKSVVFCMGFLTILELVSKDACIHDLLSEVHCGHLMTPMTRVVMILDREMSILKKDIPKAELDVPVGSWTEIRIVDK